MSGKGADGLSPALENNGFLEKAKREQNEGQQWLDVERKSRDRRGAFAIAGAGPLHKIDIET